MNKFVMQSDTVRESLEWGTLGWLSHPPATKNEQLTVIDVELFPGQGHNFHRHPDQEEVIVCVRGTVEQWLGTEMRLLNPGDAVYIDADQVHATFNEGSESAFVLAILGPCVGEAGYEVVEVADQAPWKDLR